MVSGVDAYRAGEYLYQDWIYDDHGPDTRPTVDAFDGTNVPGRMLGSPTGDLIYPTDTARYAGNAADLLEFRSRLVPDGVEYRITLNTLVDPDVVALAIGIDADLDRSTGRDDWGHGLGEIGELGLEHVIVVLGREAFLDGRPLDVSIDQPRHQISLTVPLRPDRSVWRHYLVTGLRDQASPDFAAVAVQPDASHPGGALIGAPPPVFNVAFRWHEPVGGLGSSSASSQDIGFGSWREHAQANALARRDISAMHADLDFGKLADRVDESNVPSWGLLNRLFVSRLGLGQGVGSTSPPLLGQIQPYAVYIPSGYRPDEPAPLLIELHGESGTYNQFAVYMPGLLDQLGEAHGSIILMPEARGPDGWYRAEAEVDVFEAWADLAAHYRLDPDRVALGGYSMGGYGAYKLASHYPDLFSSAWAVAAPVDPDPAYRVGLDDSHRPPLQFLTHNLRGVPTLMWTGLNDANAPVTGLIQYERALHELGYRHELQLFPGYDQLAFALADEWQTGATWLDRQIDRNPQRVTFAAVRSHDIPQLGLVHNHAYWLADVKVAAIAFFGIIDVQSLAAGEAEPRRQEVAGVGSSPSPHVRRGLSWSPSPAVPRRNSLRITMVEVASATIWLERAGIDDSRPIDLEVYTDELWDPSPPRLTLIGPNGVRTIEFPRQATTKLRL